MYLCVIFSSRDKVMKDLFTKNGPLKYQKTIKILKSHQNYSKKKKEKMMKKSLKNALLLTDFSSLIFDLFISNNI